MKLAFLSAALFGLGVGCNEAATPSPEESVMSSAPALTEAAQMAGVWILSSQAAECEIRLSAEDVGLTPGSPAAAMMAAQIVDDCTGMPQIRGWRPIPLGLELTDADGMAVLVFEQSGPDAFASVDQTWRLTPGPS